MKRIYRQKEPRFWREGIAQGVCSTTGWLDDFLEQGLKITDRLG
jgi:hypothetical protein